MGESSTATSSELPSTESSKGKSESKTKEKSFAALLKEYSAQKKGGAQPSNEEQKRREGMIFSTDDDPRGRPGLDFSTDDTSGAEESKAAASSTTMINTSVSGSKAQV